MAKSIIMQVDEATAGVMDAIQKEITGELAEKLIRHETILEEIKSESFDTISALQHQQSIMEGVEKAVGKLPDRIFDEAEDLYIKKLKVKISEIENNQEELKNSLVTIESKLNYLCLPFYKRWFGGKKNA